MKKIILVLYSFLILFFCSGYLLIDKYNANININLEEKVIIVDVKGAVTNPGVKTILNGGTVLDAIEKSGGLLDNADTSTINLSKKLNDEDVIIIYTKEEINNMQNPNNVKIVEKECICPVILNNACANPKFDTITLDTDKISINSGSLDELMTLPGIGLTKAEAIIEYRKNKLFKTLDEIMSVKGIGKALFEKIKDYITL